VVFAAGAVPGDAVIRDLFRDLCIELAKLLDLVDAAQELREGFELRPLVVGDADRDLDIDICFDSAHVCEPSFW
jgi:hypothetical protein